MEAPVITCVSKSVNTDNGLDTASVLWDGPKVSDNSGNVSHVICDPQSGTNFTIGETSVICEAFDGSGNRAECSFQVNVTGKSLCSLYQRYMLSCLSLCNGVRFGLVLTRIVA